MMKIESGDLGVGERLLQIESFWEDLIWDEDDAEKLGQQRFGGTEES